MGLIFAALALFAAVAMRRKPTTAETVGTSAAAPTTDATTTDPLAEGSTTTTATTSTNGSGPAPFQTKTPAKGKTKTPAMFARSPVQQQSLFAPVPMQSMVFAHCYDGLTPGDKEGLALILGEPSVQWDQLLKLHFEYLSSGLQAAAACLLQAAKERLIATCSSVGASSMRAALNNPAVSSATLAAAANQLDGIDLAAAACLRAWSTLFFPPGQSGTVFEG